MNPPSPPKNKWLIFFLVASGIFMSTLDSSIVNIALPAIMKDFSRPLATIEWVVVMYLLTISSFLLSFGRLSDIKGRRWVFARGFLIFTVGSLLCAVSRNIELLIAARAFQGIGASMIMACSPALVVDTFPAHERGKALGMVGTIVAAGLTTGPALGGVILKLFSWRVIFFINIPIGLIAGHLVARLLKGGAADVSRPEPFDWAGALCLMVCFAALLMLLTHLHDWGLISILGLGLAGVSIVAGAGFFVIEGRSAHPIFDLSLLRVPLFILPVCSAIILFAGLFTIIFLTPFFLIHPAGYPVEKAGLLMMIPFVLLFFVSPLTGALSDRIGSRILCTAGMIMLTAALVSFSRLVPSASPLPVAWRLALTGVGIATFLPPNSATAMSAIDPRRRGIASGTVAMVRNLGMVLGVALAAGVFNYYFETLSGGQSLNAYSAPLEPFFLRAFQHAMLAGAFLTGLGVIIAFLRGQEASRRK